MDNVENNIKRAQKLLETPEINENYVSIKIKPANGGCCCFDCWPKTWDEINFQISRYGRLQDEGDILISSNDDKFVLQCHESGPEIIVYLGVGIAGANLVTAILNLILTVIKSRQREKTGAHFKILKRVIINTKIHEENVMEVDFPLSEQNVILLNNKLKEIIKRNDN